MDKLFDIPIQKPVGTPPAPNINTNAMVDPIDPLAIQTPQMTSLLSGQQIDTATIDPVPVPDQTQATTTRLPQPQPTKANINSKSQINSPLPPTNTKIQIPDIKEMETHLQTTGQLLNEINVNRELQKENNSPLAALQPDNMLNTQDGPQPISLPSQKEKPLDDITLISTGEINTQNEIDTIALKRKAIKIIKNIVAVALAAQGLKGIYQSVKFILVDYPQLEAQLISHLMTKGQVNAFATHAVIMLLTTIISMIFAFKIIRNKTAEILHIIVGISLFLGSAYLNTYLMSNFDLANLISSPILTVINGFNKMVNNIIDIIPFVEKGADNQLKIVWYK